MLQGFILEWFSLILESIKFQSESAGKLSELSLLRFVTNLWLRIIARLWDFWQMCDRDNCSSDVHGRLTLRSIASLSPDFNKTKDASDPVEERRGSITLPVVGTRTSLRGATFVGFWLWQVNYDFQLLLMRHLDRSITHSQKYQNKCCEDITLLQYELWILRHFIFLSFLLKKYIGVLLNVLWPQAKGLGQIYQHVWYIFELYLFEHI